MLKKSFAYKLLIHDFCLMFVRQLVYLLLFLFASNYLFGQTGSGKSSPYIIHVVKFGETLTKIAQKYKVNQLEILKLNPSLTADNLNPEQIIRIPNKNTSSTKSINKTPEVVAKNKDVLPSIKTKFHIVEPGQTLYAISKLYNTKIEDIQKWNQLKDFNLKVGSKLIVAEPETKSTIKKDSILKKESNTNLPVKPIENKQVTTFTQTNTDIAAENTEIQAIENDSQMDLAKLFKERSAAATPNKVRGTGAPMTTTLGAMENVYFAMHKTLSIGTIIKIKNLTNNKIVYAKIIGNLPQTDENKHVIVRYSLGVKKVLLLQNGKCYVEIEYP